MQLSHEGLTLSFQLAACSTGGQAGVSGTGVPTAVGLVIRNHRTSSQGLGDAEPNRIGTSLGSLREKIDCKPRELLNDSTKMEDMKHRVFSGTSL